MADGVPRPRSAMIASRCKMAADGSPVASCSSCISTTEVTCRPTGGGEDDQGGGEQPRIAGAGGRIVGVQFHQPRYLVFGVPHQRHEREDLAADPRQASSR